MTRNSPSNELAQSPRVTKPQKFATYKIVAISATLSILVWNFASIFPLIRQNSAGAQDFSIFYAGARIVLSGDASDLYDLSVQARYQTEAYRLHPLPYNHPAYELILFLPLVRLPFQLAYLLWVGLNLAIAALISVLIACQVTQLPRQAALWIFAVAISSFPLVWTLCQGQDSILLLLIFVLTLANLRSGNDLAAGLILAAGLFKFAIVVPFVLPLLFKSGRRFATGFLAGSASLVAVSVAITGMEGARRYIQLLSLTAAHPSIAYINPLLMPNMRGFLLFLLSGHGVKRIEYELALAALSLLLLLVPLLVFPKQDQLERFNLWFGLNLVVAALVSPHLYWHDLSVLFLLPFLVADSTLRTTTSPGLMVGAAAAWGVVYMSPWPMSLSPALNLSPSIFFLPLLGLAFWFAIKLRSSPAPDP